MAQSVAVAVGGIGDKLVSKLTKKVESLKVGSGMDKKSEMGPLITKEHLKKVKGYVDLGVKEGAKLLVDGRNLKLQGYENGYFIGGCLFDNVKKNMRIYKEEIFGPVLSIIRAQNFDEALQLVNDHEFGNGVSIFTRDGDTARTFSNKVKIGMVGINIPIPVPVAFHSFGGWKRSMFGDQHMHGPEGVRFYTKLKTTTSRWPSGQRSDPEFVMPTMKWSMRKKISLIGAGQIGGTLAHLIAIKELADVVLFDVAEGLAKGKALDIAQSSAIDGFDVNLLGTNKYEDTKNSDVIIVTAGVPRKPGMSRDDLLGINLKIIKQVSDGIKNSSPKAFVICITNPLDVIVMALQKYSGLPKNKVVGMAGILDSSRFKYFLSQELNIPVKKIRSLVLGGHGDSMVAMIDHTYIDNKPLIEFIKKGKIKKEKLENIVERTKKGGAEIIKYLERGSAFYAPAASAVEMAESYLKNQKKELPCAAYLNGEYGVKNLYAGVPVIIGSNGVEKVVEIKLNEEERKNFDKSIKSVQELSDAAVKIDQNLA